MMLQQTRAEVVVPYYLRWMARFPTIQSLAIAKIDEVIKLWEGLGYYSRARFLHQGAQTILELFDGKFPDDPPSLEKIKGLGPYTKGAIRSFAFHQKTAAVDGNVIRVLSRLFCIKEDICNGKTIRDIWALVESILPEDRPWVFNEALIEIGALICKKKPHCQQCPLNQSCVAYKEGMAEQLPIKSTKMKTEYLYRAVAVLLFEDFILVRKGKKGEIMEDLYEFPYFDCPKEGIDTEKLQILIQQKFGILPVRKEKIKSVSHSFTKYQVRLDPELFTVQEKTILEEYQWKSRYELSKLAFSSGHRRILNHLNEASLF